MKREAIAAFLGLLVVASCMLAGCGDDERIVEPVPYSLSGYTRQAGSGAALGEVNVFVQDSILVAVSDSTGWYSFLASYNLSPEREFTFRKTGYVDASLLFPSEARVDSVNRKRYHADIILQPL